MTKQEIIKDLELGIKTKEKEILYLKGIITNQLVKAESINDIYYEIDFLASPSCNESIPRLKQYCVELKQLHEKKKLDAKKHFNNACRHYKNVMAISKKIGKKQKELLERLEER